MQSQKNNWKRTLLFSVAGVIALLGIAAFWHHASKKTMPQSAPLAATTAETHSPQTNSSSTTSVPVVSTSMLMRTSELLKAAPDARATRQQLDELRRVLSSMPTAA